MKNTANLWQALFLLSSSTSLIYAKPITPLSQPSENLRKSTPHLARDLHIERSLTVGRSFTTTENKATFYTDVYIKNEQENSNPHSLVFQKKRAENLINQGDTLGTISFQGYDGFKEFIEAARITTQAPEGSDFDFLPGDLLFYTRPPSPSTTPQLRLALKNDGSILFKGTVNLEQNVTMEGNLTVNNNAAINKELTVGEQLSIGSTTLYSNGTATMGKKLAIGFPVESLGTAISLAVLGGATIGSTTDPGNNNLRVEGNITFNSTYGLLNAVGASAENSLRIIRGRISGTAEIKAGSGFTVHSPGTGDYIITFITPFTQPPTVIANSEEMDTPAAIVYKVSTTQVTISMTTSDGHLSNSSFSFLAIGS